MIDVLFFASMLMVQEPVQIRVTTRMVEVGVLVHDLNGSPVSGLRAEDFRLLDGGREEEIRSFSVAGPGKREAAGESRVATAILLDYLNSAFKNEAFGRTELLRFLRQLEPYEPVALLSLDVGFQVLHDFTTDAASLAGALDRHRPYRPIYGGAFRPSPIPKAGPDGSMSRSSAAIMKVDAMAEAHYRNLRAKVTSSSMAALVRYLSRTPGRKNLIWVSSEFPAALAASLRSDDVAVYPVDVTTPITGPRPSARMLAESTGGVAFDHGNSVLKGIRLAYEDSGTVYVLGYYPSHDQWKGQFRRIQVSVKRPGTEVRHRTGYVAALGDDFRPPDQWETLEYVAAAPAEARGIGVTGKGTRLGDGSVKLALKLDVQTLSPGDRAHKDEWELLLVPLGKNGETMKGEYRKVEPDAAGKPEQHGGLTTIQYLAAPPETRKLRVVVRDTRTGALGSATIALNME